MIYSDIKASKDIEQEVDSYIIAIQKGQYDEAYSLMAQTFKRHTSKEEFIEVQQKVPTKVQFIGIKSYEKSSIIRMGRGDYYYQGKVVFTDGDVGRTEVGFDREFNKMKIEAFYI